MMVKLKLFVLVVAILSEYSQADRINEADIAKQTLKYGITTLKLGVNLFTGNLVGFAEELSTGVTNFVESRQADPTSATEEVKYVSKQLDNLSVDLKNVKEEVIDRIIEELGGNQELKTQLETISAIVQYVEDTYRKFVDYMKDPAEISKDIWLGFARTHTGEGRHDLPYLLQNLHESFYKNNDIASNSVLSLLSGQTDSNLRKRKQSLQQTLYILSKTIILADVKGYAIIRTSYNLRNLFNNGEKVERAKQIAKERFDERIKNVQKSVKSAMKSASRTLLTYDSTYKEGVTYTKLENLFQTYVINKIHTNHLSSCIPNCREYPNETIYINENGCKGEELCEKQKGCDGALWNCGDLSASTICLSKSSEDHFYEYIDVGSEKRTCKNDKLRAAPWDILSECIYCTCTCDRYKNKKSDRYINARRVEADIDNNYVVTGLQLVKKNHVLHIQIKQGKLLPGGDIDRSTNDWKSVDDYTINGKVQEDKDFYTIKWLVYNPNYMSWRYKYSSIMQNAIDLEDVNLSWLYKEDKEKFKSSVCQNSANKLNCNSLEPADYHLLTGIRVKKETIENDGNHFHLEVRMTPFNFTTGKLVPQKSIWHSRFHHFDQKGDYKRIISNLMKKTEVNLENLDIPRGTGAKAVPTSKDNELLKFRPTSMDKDAGQNTIPFIDLQSVETNPPMPLSGAGFYHKSSPGTGGFLALKVFTFNYEPYFKLSN